MACICVRPSTACRAQNCHFWSFKCDLHFGLWAFVGRCVIPDNHALLVASDARQAWRTIQKPAREKCSLHHIWKPCPPLQKAKPAILQRGGLAKQHLIGFRTNASILPTSRIRFQGYPLMQARSFRKLSSLG